MSSSDNVVDFNVIENQKENIQSLPSGRSAKALVNLLSGGGKAGGDALGRDIPAPQESRTINDAIRKDFDAELAAIQDADDPLEVYDRYVKWTLDAYPSAQATAQSGLLPLLERATKTFQASPEYKNDPRYLRLWLLFIRLFSDAPREVFSFLSRHDIGDRLALFYEEFAAWLESAGRIHQAEEIYQMGLEKQARPAERLLRKYKEFQHRVEAQPPSSDGPSSPALPKIRPALAAKTDPFASIRQEQPQQQAQQQQQQQQQQNSSRHASGRARSGKPKLAIFSDTQASTEAEPAISTDTKKGWEDIGSSNERRKENAQEPQPWVGQTLKGGKKPGASSKLQVYKDETQRQSFSSFPSFPPPSASTSMSSVKNPRPPVFPMDVSTDRESVNPRTGRIERVCVDLKAMYSNPSGAELCIDELRAARRGILDTEWGLERHAPTNDASGEESFTQEGQSLGEEDMTKLGEPTPRNMKTMKTRGDTQTIKAKLDSPTGPKMRRKSTAEPTMTLHTRAATDEIYSIFNQPLKSELKASDDDMYQSDYYDEDDFTSTTETTGRISGAGSEFGEEDVTTMTTRTEDDDEVEDDTRQSRWTEYDDEQGETTTTTTATATHAVDSEEVTMTSTSSDHFNPPIHPYRDPETVAQSRLPFMTPIVEVTETSLASAMSNAQRQMTGAKMTGRKPNFFAQTPAIPEDEQTLRSPFRDLSFKEVPTDKKKLAVFTDEATPSRQTFRRSPHETAGKLTPKFDGLVTASPIAPMGQQPSFASPGKSPVQRIRSPLFLPQRDNNDSKKAKVIINQKRCTPTDSKIKYEILKKLDPPLSAWPGYVEHGETAEHIFSSIRKYVRALSKLSKAEKQGASGPVLDFEDAQRTYILKRELGEGGFAPVYLVESMESAGALESFSPDKSFTGHGSAPFLISPRPPLRRSLEAIKIEQTLNSSWEFHMLCLSRRRLQMSAEYARVADSITAAHELHCFQDEGFLVEEYEDQGTLVDLVNVVKNEPGRADMGLDEAVAMFFTVELLRTLEGLHVCGILHADIKPDNCLVRLATDSSEVTATKQYHDDDDDDAAVHHPDQYSSTGNGPWRNNGLKLIDFGRSIDITVFPPDVQFIADWETGPHECNEVRENRPWTYQIDLFGIAGVIHILLYGRYMDVIPATTTTATAGEKSYRIKETLKRYWERELWSDVFDLCLNPGHQKWVDMERRHAFDSNLSNNNNEDDENTPPGPRLPALASMRDIRRRMEVWLEQRSEKKGLFGQLKKLEGLMARKRKTERMPER